MAIICLEILRTSEDISGSPIQLSSKPARVPFIADDNGEATATMPDNYDVSFIKTRMQKLVLYINSRMENCQHQSTYLMRRLAHWLEQRSVTRIRVL